MKLSCCAGLASFVPQTVDAKQLEHGCSLQSKTGESTSDP